MTLLQAVSRNALGLALFALVTAGAIALTQTQAKERIQANREAAAAKALYEIIPRQRIDNDLLRDVESIEPGRLPGMQQVMQVHRARKDGEVIAIIIPITATDGYTGNIEMIVGIEADGTLAGVRVLSHQETPGLGDKVDLKKSNWVLSFNGERLRGLDDPEFAVKKDGGRFDQFTGATITPRAVVGAVKRTLAFFAENRAHLIDGAPWEALNNG